MQSVYHLCMRGNRESRSLLSCEFLLILFIALQIKLNLLSQLAVGGKDVGYFTAVVLWGKCSSVSLVPTAFREVFYEMPAYEVTAVCTIVA